ncbi:MAG: hypothetical protein ACKVU4_05910 [Phycisphaerales bacterium]
MPDAFPRFVETRLFGRLLLNEVDCGDFVARCYSPGTSLSVAGRGPVKLVAWPPKDGVPDPAKLAAFVEDRWEAIVSSLDRILAAAEPVVAESLRHFCDPELVPDTRALLASVRLDMIKINADGDHEVQFHDVADLVGSHDLLLGLGARLQPSYAHFDG